MQMECPSSEIYRPWFQRRGRRAMAVISVSEDDKWKRESGAARFGVHK